MWTGEVWEPLWSSGHLDMYKEAHYECILLCFLNEPLELWLHAKKGDGVAEDQRKQSADGPAAADKIQIFDT